jgi:hypothetical protein
MTPREQGVADDVLMGMAIPRLSFILQSLMLHSTKQAMVSHKNDTNALQQTRPASPESVHQSFR